METDTAARTADGMATRLADAQGDVERLELELREAIDARNALVFEAVDLFHMTYRHVGRVLDGASKAAGGDGFTHAGVHKILAGGPPQHSEAPAAS